MARNYTFPGESLHPKHVAPSPRRRVAPPPSCLTETLESRVLFAVNGVARPEGLVGFWAFDQADVNGTVVHDRSGKGRDGTLVGDPVLASGRHRDSVQLDGADDRVVVANLLPNGATQLTAAAWVYKDETAAEGRVISKATSPDVTDPNYLWSLGISGDVIQVRLPNGAGVDSFNGPRILARRWTHVAFTYDGSAVRIYVNGRLRATHAHSGDIPAANMPTVIGNSDDGLFHRFFKGRLDDVRLYDRALTDRAMVNLFYRAPSTLTMVLPAPPAPLIDEDFSAGAANFAAAGGQWSASGGAYAVTADNNAATTHLNTRTVHNTAVTGDFTLEVDATALAAAAPWANFSVLFGYQDANNYYFFSSNQSNDEETSGIFKVVNGASTELADVPAGITPGVTYHVKVVRSGDQIFAYRDGVLLAAASDATYTSGRVGLGVRQFRASFDNLVVTGTAAPVPTPTAPAAPSDLTALAASSSQINLSWTDNSDNETGFKVERSTDGVNFTQVATVAAGLKTYAARGLAPSTEYTFRVRATNTFGDSGYSNTASATTQQGTTVPKPDATNTGYSGSLTTVSGAYTARAGEVIENKLFTGGIIVPAGADNVIIRNCKITGAGQYGIRCWDGARNLMIQNVEIDGLARPGAIGSKGIVGSNFTAERCHIHHAGSDGIQTVGSNITIRQCYIHDNGYGGYDAANPVDSDHTDGIQVFGGSHILIEYNTVITRHGGTREDGVSTGFPLQSQVNPYGTANSAVVLQSDESSGGPIDDFQVSNNWLDGGIFTLRLEEKDGNEMTNGRVFGNRFGRDYFFGPATASTGTPSYTASDNVYDDNGSPVRGL